MLSLFFLCGKILINEAPGKGYAKKMFEAPESTHPLAKKFERPEDKLGVLVQKISARQNEEFCRSPESQPLLNPDCAINMDAFGYYDIDQDKKRIYKQDVEWSGANLKKNEDLTEKIVAQYKINKKRNANGRWENAAIFLLYKILGNRYLIVKAAEYDDYFNGTDTLVVDKETGDVICALDEVHENIGGARHEKKIRATEATARQGGAEIKYGISFEKDKHTGENKLVKKRLTNVPRFYLRISHFNPETNLDLQNLLENMNYNLDSEPSEIELKIFDMLMDSLTEQRKKQREIIDRQNRDDNDPERHNLAKAKKSLHQMREIRKLDFPKSLAA